MATSAGRTSAKSFVDSERGLISRELFVSEEIYAQEQEQVFTRAWLLVGHESQIPKPGDYFIGRMGEESVIMARDRAGKVHVFLNSCRHRGMKVCRYDEGNTPVFTCPYHGWSYGLDGSLVGVPYFKEAYHSELKKEEWGLVEVGQMASHRGWIWATWDKEAPGFEEYLGGMKIYLEAMIAPPDGSDTPVEIIGGIHKWIMPANWKFAAENFIGDFYHGISHRSVDLVGISPSGRKGRHTEDFNQVQRMLSNAAFPEGHGAGSMLLLEEPRYVNSYALAAPAVEEYYRNAHRKRVENLGETAKLNGAVGTVFPNASFSAARSVAVWHPAGPGMTEAWRWYWLPVDAPDEVKETLRHYAIRYAGAPGMTEQDDMENWNYATAASKGTIARRYPYNYQMGMAYEGTTPRYDWLPATGQVTEGTTEQNQRHMYKRWAEYMDAKSWADLKPRP